MTDKPVRPPIPEQVFLQPSCGSPTEEELKTQAARLDADAKVEAAAAAGPARARTRSAPKGGVRIVSGGAPSLGKRRR
jgi:hypothetical protein